MFEAQTPAEDPQLIAKNFRKRVKKQLSDFADFVIWQNPVSDIFAFPHTLSLPTRSAGISLAFNVLRRFVLKPATAHADKDQNRMTWCVASETNGLWLLPQVSSPLMPRGVNGKIIVFAES